MRDLGEAWKDFLAKCTERQLSDDQKILIGRIYSGFKGFFYYTVSQDFLSRSGDIQRFATITSIVVPTKEHLNEAAEALKQAEIADLGKELINAFEKHHGFLSDITEEIGLSAIYLAGLDYLAAAFFEIFWILTSSLEIDNIQELLASSKVARSNLTAQMDFIEQAEDNKSVRKLAREIISSNSMFYYELYQGTF